MNVASHQSIKSVWCSHMSVIMTRYIIYFIILVHASQSEKQYRADYEYNHKNDAFYKLHTELVNNQVARESCEVEGAKLIDPSPRDIVQAHGMLKQFPDIGDQAWTADDGLPHDSGEYIETIDLEAHYNTEIENSMQKQCVAVTRKGDVEKLSCLEMLPFICKVEAKYATYDPHCKVYSKGYQYLENVGSCYKISSTAYSWNQAYDECRAEGAHLLVLNSELEHQAVHNLTHYAPKISSNAHSPWYWHAGVRAEKTADGSPVVYKTIFGQTLKEAGYDQWSVGEPNNLNGKELCGSIFTNDGKYNDLDCFHLFAFICEKEIHVQRK